MDFSYNPSRSSYGQCDSYFVESDDQGLYARHAAAREQARATARAYQQEIAEQLSYITSDEYQDDIVDYMEYTESITLPDVNSIDVQTEIEWYMRPYLLDFLIEAHAAFQLHTETLYLAINLLDRYCSKRIVYKKHYQLVGCASLLIAAKYGDRKDRVPTVRELKSMCCALYEDEMFVQMEWHVLATLDWLIGHPTVDNFLQIAFYEMPNDPQFENMARYICEIALFHKEFVSIRPSIMARSALFLARGILSRQTKTQTSWASKCDHQVVEDLWQKLEHPSPVLRKKYGCNQLSQVAVTLEVFLQRQTQLAPISVEVHLGEQKHATYGMPITPQKVQCPNGYMTPPITPDSDMHGAACTQSKYQVLPRISPASPSPASNAQQAQYLQYRPSDLRYYVQ